MRASYLNMVGWNYCYLLKVGTQGFHLEGVLATSNPRVEGDGPWPSPFIYHLLCYQRNSCSSLEMIFFSISITASERHTMLPEDIVTMFVVLSKEFAVA